MTDAGENFDALFDEVSAKHASATSAAGGKVEPKVSTVVMDAEPLTIGTGPSEATEDESGKPVFQRLGGIVRLLHDALRELGHEKALTDASSHIGDAQDRLEFVSILTEQAATKVLNAVDEGLPAQEILAKKAKAMERRWADLFDGKLSPEEFKTLAGDSKKFALAVANASEAEKARLLDIMMAQDFQDITGQMIKKVIAVTQILEFELAKLLRDSAPPAMREKLQTNEELMQGPSVPGVGLAQDNVDELLEDLGF